MSDKITAIETKLGELPEGREHEEARIDLLNELAWQLRESGQWKRILSLANQARELAKACSHESGLAGGLRNAAFAHYMLADYGLALTESVESLSRYQGLGDRKGEADAQTVIGLVQWSLGNYEKGLKAGFRALSTYEALGDQLGMAWCYTVIGAVHQNLRDYGQALLHHEKSRRMFAAMNHRLGEARTLTGIGTVYQALGDPKKALEYHEHSLELYRSIDNRVGESRALNDIGTIYQEQDEDEKALELHLRSLQIRTEDDNRQAQTTSLLNLGRLYLKRNETSKAIELSRKALTIAEEIGAKPKAYQAHQLLSQVYEGTGELATALRHAKAFQRIREEVFNEEASTKLKNLQISQEVERSQKEAEIERLRNVELKQKNEQLARLVDELQATQAQLVQSEKMSALGGLVAAIAHEINSPLGAIQSSVHLSLRCAERIAMAIEASQSLEDLKSNRSLAEALKALRENERVAAVGIQRITKIVQSLKSFARLDQAEYQQADLTEALEDTLTLLEPDFREKVRIAKSYGAIPKVYCYPAELNQVFMNLLRNAAQAIENKGTITITTFADDKHVHIKFADTGCGIPPEQLPRLFDPGLTTEGSRVKAAMSLFTCLNIMQKHHGDIRVESEVGKYTTFTLLVPRDLEARVGT
jgi:signal transduction histidine kinase